MTEVDSSNDEVALSFAITSYGWADVSLRVVSETFNIEGVSYTGDGLGGLVRFALGLVVGETVAECSFDLEPAEIRLRGVSDSVTVHLSVYKFADGYSDNSISEEARVLYTTCRIDALGRAVSRTADAVLREHGLAGYKFGWREEFPLRALAALKAALAAQAEGLG